MKINEVTFPSGQLAGSEINGLNSNSWVVGSGVYDNTAGYPGGYVFFQPGASFSTYPAVNSSINIYFLKSLNGGSAYEAGSNSILPTRMPDLVLPLSSGSSGVADNTLMGYVSLAPFLNKVLIQNSNAGVSIPNGSVIGFIPQTDQVL